MKSESQVLINIGKRLQYLREQKGFKSYERFAIEYELSRMHYWQIEKGKKNITFKSFIRLLDIHEISIEEFFDIEVKE